MTNVEKLDALDRLIQKTQPRRAWEVTDDFDINSDLDLENAAIVFEVQNELTAYKLAFHYSKMGLDVEIQDTPDAYYITVKEKNNG